MNSKKKRERRPLWVVGWREWIALPDLGIEAVKVKIDTGARSSTLHAFDVERFRRAGKPMVRFAVHPLQRNNAFEVMSQAPLIDVRKIRSSSGDVQERYVVRTHARLLELTWPIELTLTNRDEMGFRMLLGRQALRGRFLIDPGRSFAAGRPALKIRRPKPKRDTR